MIRAITLTTLLLACRAADGAPTAASPPPAAPKSGLPLPAPAEAPSIVAPVIVDHPLPYGPERERLTVAYLQAHRTAALTGDAAKDTRMVPRVIVLHWTAGPTAASAWSTFSGATLSGRADIAGAGALNVGAHYLVDRDGTIERLAPEDQILRHTIGLNHVAIGIENVGGGKEWPLTEAQVDANVALVRWIAARQPITHVIGHLEYRSLEVTPLFEERDPTYRTTKPDPGADFMAAVRARLTDTTLLGPPPG
ncbi:MAG: peptidoglycan recognition family protein [Pseudomonadota bacterium]|nr:peptidoglycan recognition family protein [Pseudomonadota bacterium]